MLAINLKRSFMIDLITPFNSYINDNFSPDESIKVQSPLQEIQDLRTKLVGLFNNPAGDVEPIYLLTLRYYNFLKILDTRFPFGKFEKGTYFGIFEKTKKTPAVSIPFEWSDSYWRKKTCVQYTLDFESACILFNLSALSSLCGAKEDRSTDEGLKQACKYFQRSCTFLTEINNRHFASDTLETLDLCHESVNFLSSIMLAQAQACAFELSFRKSNSPSTLAKLACGVATLFNNASNSVKNNSAFSKWLATCGYPWVKHSEHQYNYFMGQSRSFEAKASIEAEKYGIQITNLKSSMRYLTNSGNIEKAETDLADLLVKSRITLSESVSNDLVQAEKYNDKVYHYAVPSVEELGVIESKVLVKSTPIESLSIPTVSDLFTDLIPIAIHEDSKKLYASLKEWVANIKSVAEEKTRITQDTLSHLKLPGALDSLQSNFGLPPSLIAKISALQQLNGGQGVLALFALREGLENIAQVAWTSLSEIKGSLHEEFKYDESQRNRFTKQWQRTPSAEITQSFHKDLDQIENYLMDSQASNTTLYNSMDSNKDKLRLLALSISELTKKLFPSESSLSPRNNSVLTSQPYIQLQALLTQLSHLIETRTSTIALIESKANSYSFTAALLSNRDKSAEQVFANEIKANFDELNSQLILNYSQQEPILSQLSVQMVALGQLQQNDPSAKDRVDKIQSIFDCISLNDRLVVDFKSGIDFYQNLMENYIERLKPNVSDFCYARQEEARALLEQITHSLSKMSINNSTQPAPNTGVYSPPQANTQSFQKSVQGYRPPAQNPAYNPASYNPPQNHNPSSNQQPYSDQSNFHNVRYQ